MRDGLEALLRVVDQGDLVTGAHQHALQQHARGAIVVDHENSTGNTGRDRGHGRRRAYPRPALHGAQTWGAVTSPRYSATVTRFFRGARPASTGGQRLSRKRSRRPRSTSPPSTRPLGKVIARVGQAELEPTPDFDPFHALVRSICHQQLHGKAAETILGRVNAKFGDGTLADLNKVRRARIETMRGCGLSLAKALAIKDLALKCADGTVPTAKELHTMTDDEIVERVSQVRGIGRWTVEMMLMFRMGRLDVFPVDDFGVRKGFTLLRKLKAPITPKALVAAGRGLEAVPLAWRAGTSGGWPMAAEPTGELEALGYKQELLRDMGAFQNFALSFSVISILTGGGDALRRAGSPRAGRW